MSTIPCISTVDNNGVPYRTRLKNAREAIGKSPEEIAALLTLSLPEYYDWESHDGELTMVASLNELSKLSSALGIRTRFIFEDGEPGQSISLEQLSAKMKAHLSATGMTVDKFEEKVGFVIEPALRNPAEALKWNVDCLRFVCKEIGLDWCLALP